MRAPQFSCSSCFEPIHRLGPPADHVCVVKGIGKGSQYSITERRVPELIPILGRQPAVDVSHKPDGRLPLLFTRPALTPATLQMAATNFTAW